MSVISLNYVTKVFTSPMEKKQGIFDLSLDIEQGEIVMVTGSVGSGKTTLMRLIAGLIKPDQGSCSILNTDLFSLSLKERLNHREKNLGLYFSEIPLLNECTVYENIALPLYIEAVSKEELKESIQETISFFDIESLLKAYPSQLSLGEIQLVSLARALVHQPKILIFDEPVSFIDHSQAVRFLTHLKDLTVAHNITVVLTTSDIRLHPFATRVVKLSQGKIKEILGEHVEGEESFPFMKL